jgi:uroporphyrin-III C-methyltransferase
LKTGRVILVGAGPGDPELLTLKAVRALREADVVLHDDLVVPEILAFVRCDARVIAVGKRGGCRSTPQSFIEQLLVREARAGNCVVRLKGGDPYVFGRGGEEVATLRAAGVAVSVICGVTAGLAAAASIGIPVTHRALARGVALVTGHAADGNEPDWTALVKSGLTLVIYMGLSRAAEVRDALRRAGMPGTMPVAVIANASRPEQTALVATLDTFVAAARAAGIASPAIIIAGEVVSCGDLMPLVQAAPPNATRAVGVAIGALSTLERRAATRYGLQPRRVLLE